MNVFIGTVVAWMLLLFVTVTPAAAVENDESPVTRLLATHNVSLPPEPHPGFYDDVGKCLKNITEQCGEQIYHGIFRDHGPVSTGCCDNLVGNGIKCHVTIVLSSVQLLHPELTRDDADTILDKSYFVWSKCVSALAHDVEAPASSPVYAF